MMSVLPQLLPNHPFSCFSISKAPPPPLRVWSCSRFVPVKREFLLLLFGQVLGFQKQRSLSQKDEMEQKNINMYIYCIFCIC